MPVYRLSDTISFPSPGCAAPGGLLAVGGDLRAERLLEAYRTGIFPWYSSGCPILWWSPDPRLVLDADRVAVSRSLGRTLRKQHFQISMDRCFEKVIHGCAAAARPGSGGTWIVGDMIEAYCELHRRGYAHSVEVWQEGRLAGGLYGVSLGGAFFGESMFSLQRDASKVALVRLASVLCRWNIMLIDCQVSSEHLKRMGAYEMPRKAFLQRLSTAQRKTTRCGRWHMPEGVPYEAGGAGD